MATMKRKLFVPALLILFPLVSENLHAQCSGCTTTISSANSVPQVVGAGQKLCIASSGIVQGALVISGGEVCNEGAIVSASIALVSGTLVNHGTMNTAEFAVTSGTVTNEGAATFDSLGIFGVNIAINNNGILNARYLALFKTGTGSEPILNNNGSLSADSLSVNLSRLVNSGTVQVNSDFSNLLNGTVINTGDMSVGRDFSNAGTFSTSCMIPVGRDWSNSGSVTGPSTGCGGFTVNGLTGNYGTFGTDNSNLDMCDLGNPLNGFDGYSGTTGSNVTYCVCVNNCQSTSAVQSPAHRESTVHFFPNPFHDEVVVTFMNPANQPYVLKLFDVRGNLVFSKQHITGNEIRINEINLPAGCYFFLLAGKDFTECGKIIRE